MVEPNLVGGNRQGKAVFLLTQNYPNGEASESEQSVRGDDTMADHSLQKQTTVALPDIKNRLEAAGYEEGPTKDGEEETFEQFEERIEGNLYRARHALREGQKESSLLDSEMRSL